jgi:RimK family alpha-L-glutamate ligase
MLDLLVFTQYPRTYGPRRFEALKLGLECKVKSYKYTDINDLPEATHVIFREPTASKNIYDFRDKILDYYISKKSIILNQHSYSKWSVLDKITQTLEFEKAGIPHIKNLKPEELKYPYIVKNKLGSHGDSVYKITCKEDLDNVLEKHKIEDLLFQEFQTSGFDLRVIVLGAARLGASRGKVLEVMKRTPKSGEFLSNYSQGGKIQEYEDKSDESISQIALKTAEHFKLDYVGVDLMLNNQKEWVVLEVNRACQFKGFEQATGVNIAKEVIVFLLEI